VTPSPDSPPTRRARRVETALIVLALGLAGLVSAFVARNADLWRHLAVGRLVAAGEYDFTSDPLSFATVGQQWVNHAWLTEWLAYQTYRVFGGAGLVFVKAALVALVTGLGLFSLRRDRPRWLAVAFVAAAVVAWSPRAHLQPLVVSCLLFAVLLKCLTRGGRTYRAIPLLTVAWVNLDEWFVLAPALVTLHWVAAALRGDRSVPLWLPVATLLACLASPFHVFGLTLPTELSPAFWSSELSGDARVAAEFGSYFAGRPFLGEYADSASFWAYCAVVVTGTVSLAVGRRTVGPTAAGAWLMVVGLSVWQARLVPFCAVAAVLLIAPRLQSVAVAATWGRVGRWGTLALTLASAVAPWAGWLHGARGRDRTPGLAVHADPSLVRAAESLVKLRTDGQLPPQARVLVTSPSGADTFTWFAPGERGYLDTRWNLHARTGRVRSLDPANVGTPPGEFSYWRELAAEYDIAAVLVPEPSPALLVAATAKGSQWRLLRLDGRVAWLVPNGSFGGRRFDPDALAFAPSVTAAPPAARLPDPPEWWRPGTAQPTPAGLDAATATGLLNFHLATGRRGPALPLMAIRAARRGIAANPNDGAAWLELGRAYSLLAGTSEADAVSASGFVGELRRVQRVTALAAAVAANPESEAARGGLAATYGEIGFLDRSLAERRRQLVLIRRRGETDRANAVAATVADQERDLFDRECLFAVRTQGKSGDPLGRAKAAVSLGLSHLAQDTLLKSSPELYGNEGLRLLAGLLVGTGQTAEAAVLLDRDELRQNPAALGFHELPALAADGRTVVFQVPAYDWFRFLLASATGLDDPRTALAALLAYSRRETNAIPAFLADVARPVASQVAAGVGLAAAFTPAPQLVIGLQRDVLLARVTGALALTVKRAELLVLAGACELEAGDSAAAARRFAAALAEYDRAAATRIAPARRLAERYARELVVIRPRQ